MIRLPKLGSRKRGDEKSRQSKVKLTWRSGLWLPVIAVILILLALIPGESTPDLTVGASREIPTNVATFACPVQKGAEVAVGQIKAGTSADAKAVPEADVSEVWTQVDQWRTAKPSAGALVISQEGEGSGPVGYVAGSARKNLGGGQLFSRCPGLLDEGWFIGLADQGKSVIQLANLGDSLAVVDIYWWSTLGRVEGDHSMGIVIDPGKTTTVAIGDNVPGEEVVGARIVRRRQQVSAVALSANKAGQGTEFALPQAELDDKLVLAGFPTKGTATVSLLNPHDETVRVKIQGIRAGGTFDIQGLEDVAVKPQTTLRVDVPEKAKLGGQAIQLTAEKEIAAIATVQTAKDFAIVGPAEWLRHPTAVPISLAGQKVQLTLVAPKESVSIVIEGVDSNMKVVSTKNISVPAGSSMVVDLQKELGDSVAAVVTADGEAYAGAWTRKGDQIASTPLYGAPVSVRVPAVAVH